MDRLSNAAIERGPARGRPRLAWLDAARGAAIVAMVVYHSAWDLSELRLVETVVTAEPAWRGLAWATAASFLALAGIGIVLAHGGGVRWPALWRRLVAIAAAAALITAATWFVFPDSYVFFGILHQMVLASLLALPFARGPGWLAALAAAAVWLAPLALTQPAFDAPALAFLGLGTRVPNTNDWVPVFPWFGFVLAGVAAAKFGARLGDRESAAEPTRPVRALAWLGRHSLAIYLVHQPLIFGALSGLVAVTGPNPVAEAAPFLGSCRASCREAGQAAELCGATCACTADALRREDLWRGVVANRLQPEQSRRVGALARECLVRSRE